MEETYIAGHTGVLSYWDVSAYKPIACLTSTSLSRTLEVKEKVNMCTAGEIVKTAGAVERSLSIEGEVVVEAGKASLTELEAIIKAGTEKTFKLGRGASFYYFTGLLTDLSDNFQAGEDATFSATLTLTSAPSATDPNA